MKILVIEDEKMLADSIKEMLERKGFQLGVVGKPARDEVRLPFFTVLITSRTSFGGGRNPRN